MRILISAILSLLPLTAYAIDMVVPINIRPFSCQKDISRTGTKDVPIAIYNDISGFPGVPSMVTDVTIEDWVKPTKIKIFSKNDKRQCTVRPGSTADNLVVYYFPRRAILNLYDVAAYTNQRTIALVTVHGQSYVRINPLAFVGYAPINIVK